MSRLFSHTGTFFFLLLTLALIEGGLTTDLAEARSRAGGRSFGRAAPSTPAPQAAPKQMQQNQQKQNSDLRQPSSGFGRGLAGGLIGGALGGLLFGSLFGMGGSGMGILPFILLGVMGFFFYRQFFRHRQTGAASSPSPRPAHFEMPANTEQHGQYDAMTRPRAPEPAPPATVEDGLALIHASDPDFDPAHFVEVASDVFFQVQAGWMRRDLSSYGHLLGKQLAGEYAERFREMEARHEINKLENISIRKVEIVDAGSVNGEDFVTVLFTANLLDYTVHDTTGELLGGNTGTPVKFAEEWTWARPITTQDWRLESIREAEK